MRAARPTAAGRRLRQGFGLVVHRRGALSQAGAGQPAHRSKPAAGLPLGAGPTVTRINCSSVTFPSACLARHHDPRRHSIVSTAAVPYSRNVNVGLVRRTKPTSFAERPNCCAATPPHSMSSFWLDRESVGWGMQDPSNDPHLRAADEFLALSKTAATPFMRAYYERVALRYLSSDGQMKEPDRHRASIG